MARPKRKGYYYIIRPGMLWSKKAKKWLTHLSEEFNEGSTTRELYTLKSWDRACEEEFKNGGTFKAEVLYRGGKKGWKCKYYYEQYD